MEGTAQAKPCCPSGNWVPRALMGSAKAEPGSPQAPAKSLRWVVGDCRGEVLGRGGAERPQGHSLRESEGVRSLC